MLKLRSNFLRGEAKPAFVKDYGEAKPAFVKDYGEAKPAFAKAMAGEEKTCLRTSLVALCKNRFD